jgi:predicted secreted hydrolase
MIGCDLKNKRPGWLRAVVACPLVLLMGLYCGSLCVFAGTDQGYLSVTGPCGFSFPSDHGAHPGYRTEWWYYTGNLEGENQHPYGFQLTFFRRQLGPPTGKTAAQTVESAWRTRQIYLGHAAVSDIAAGRHLQAEAMARNALGMAGVLRNEGETTIYLKNWTAVINGDIQVLQAHTDQFGLDLRLSAMKPPVFHGQDGYSRKGSGPEMASCYYSFTRLQARGTLVVAGRSVSVAGNGWMDHEFSTAPLEPGITGWDWFSIQLSDQTEIMIFLLRKKSGEYHAVSSGTYVDPLGQTRHLSMKDFNISVRDTWRSPKSKAVYPAKWDVKVVPLKIALHLSSRLADQEMITRESTGVTYWEGSVSVQGTRGAHSLTGTGYVELTGYAQPFEADL